jgi:hypothetical protein
MKKFTLLFLFYTVATFCIFAQSGVSVQSTVDRNQILIGDVINYSIAVSHNENIELQMPSPAANLGMFEIRDYEMLDPVQEDESIVERTAFLLSTFDTGEYEIPELPIQYRAVGDSTWVTIFSEPIIITVASLNPDSTGDIREIKPPMTPARDYRAIVKWSLLGLLALSLIAFLLYYIKRRREGKSLLPTRAQPPRPAHDIALDALDKLNESNLLANGEIKEYYSQLSDIIRQYIENRYFIMALEMTTTQLLQSMQASNLQDQNIETMADFLSTCDLVKFAAFKPEEDMHQQKTKSAYDFVNATKLVILESPVEEDKEILKEDESVVIEEEIKKEENSDV